MNRELLAAGGCRTCEHCCFIFAKLLFQYVEDNLVVHLGIVVMHLLRIGTVEVHYIRRDTFAEVCLEAVYAHVDEVAQVAGIPFASCRVSEVYKPHACLPQIRLIDVAVSFFD
ncbi:hypothetical protein D3C73_1342420 [compost metagenome]